MIGREKHGASATLPRAGCAEGGDRSARGSEPRDDISLDCDGAVGPGSGRRGGEIPAENSGAVEARSLQGDHRHPAGGLSAPSAARSESVTFSMAIDTRRLYERGGHTAMTGSRTCTVGPPDNDRTVHTAVVEHHGALLRFSSRGAVAEFLEKHG